MHKQPLSLSFLWAGLVLMALLVSACGPGQFLGPTVTASPTVTLTPSPTQTPTETPAPTDTLIPPTATPSPTRTPEPQTLLLRRRCGRDHVVNANEPLRLLYGGWGVIGRELADEWRTALVAELTIDGEVITGELQPPTTNLPLNCIPIQGNLYWLYYAAVLPGLPPGEHSVRVIISSDRALPDGTGPRFGPGPLLEQTFFITAQ